MENMKGESMMQLVVIGALGLFAVFGSIGGCMWGMPKYSVYSAEMRGKAVFIERRADNDRKMREVRQGYEAGHRRIV